MCISIDPSKSNCWKVLSENCFQLHQRNTHTNSNLEIFSQHISVAGACALGLDCAVGKQCPYSYLLCMLLYRIKAIHSSPSHVWILVFEFHLLQSVAVLVQVTFCSTLLLGLRLVSGEVRSIHFHLFLLNWISIFSPCVFLQRPSEGFVTLQVSAPNIKTVFTMVGKS